jgi:hypothetical protein
MFGNEKKYIDGKKYTNHLERPKKEREKWNGRKDRQIFSLSTKILTDKRVSMLTIVCKKRERKLKKVKQMQKHVGKAIGVWVFCFFCPSTSSSNVIPSFCFVLNVLNVYDPTFYVTEGVAEYNLNTFTSSSHL